MHIPRVNKFVLTVSLLIFIMISAIACGIHTQMVKEWVHGLKQFVTDTAPAVANIAEYRRSVAIDLISTLSPTEEQLLVGLRIAYVDPVSSSYLYDAGPYLISSDECTQAKEFEKNYCADIMQVAKYRHVKNTGFISFDGKTFIYYLYPVIHNRSLIFLLGLECFSLLSKSLAVDGENLMFSLFKGGESMTGDKYNAKNAILTVSEAMGHFSHLPTGLYVFAYKKDVYFQVCTLTIFSAALVVMIPGVSYLYLVHRMTNRGIAEKEIIINNHSECVLDGGLFFPTADVKKLYSMHSSAFLGDLTRAMGRKPSNGDLKVSPEKGGYSCLLDVDKFKNINDIFGHLLGDEVLVKAMKILKSQIPVGKGKVYRLGDDEFAVICTGGTLKELLSILEEIVHFQVGSINLSTGIDAAHSSECTTVERLKMLTDERLYKSKKNGRTQISWQQSLFAGRTNGLARPELIKSDYPANHAHRRARFSFTKYYPA